MTEPEPEPGWAVAYEPARHVIRLTDPKEGRRVRRAAGGYLVLTRDHRTGPSSR